MERKSYQPYLQPPLSTSLIDCLLVDKAAVGAAPASWAELEDMVHVRMAGRSEAVDTQINHFK